MNRLFLLVGIVFNSLLMYGQCNIPDFIIKKQNGMTAQCFSTGSNQYRIDVCPANPSQYQLSSSVNNSLTVTPSSGGNYSVSPGGSYMFPPFPAGNFTIQNTVTLTKTIISFVTITPEPIASIDILGLKNDTLIYCRNHGYFDPFFLYI
ncbi:MAG: hypothetical protein H7329_18455 [Opitutaceae bacterium]|nr:hypothetical protein [Cytophagales bacterium]